MFEWALTVQSFRFEWEGPGTSVWGVLISSLTLLEQERKGQHHRLNFCWDNAIIKTKFAQTAIKAHWCTPASEKTDGSTVIQHCSPVRNGGNGNELLRPVPVSHFQDQEVRTEVRYTTAMLAEPYPQTTVKRRQSCPSQHPAPGVNQHQRVTM